MMVGDSVGFGFTTVMFLLPALRFSLAVPTIIIGMFICRFSLGVGGLARFPSSTLLPFFF